MSLGALSSDTPSIQALVLDIITPQQESFANSNKAGQKIGGLGSLRTFQSFSCSKKTAESCLQRIIVSLAEINRELQFFVFCMLRRLRQEVFTT